MIGIQLHYDDSKLKLSSIIFFILGYMDFFFYLLLSICSLYIPIIVCLSPCHPLTQFLLLLCFFSERMEVPLGVSPPYEIFYIFWFPLQVLSSNVFTVGVMCSLVRFIPRYFTFNISRGQCVCVCVLK